MKRITIIAMLISLSFFSCMKDKIESIDSKTIKISDGTYKMPIVTTDLGKLKANLLDMTDDIEVINQNSDIIVKARFSPSDKNLFTSFHYTFKKGGTEGILFSYKFNESKDLSLKMKRAIINHINQNSEIII